MRLQSLARLVLVSPVLLFLAWCGGGFLVGALTNMAAAPLLQGVATVILLDSDEPLDVTVARNCGPQDDADQNYVRVWVMPFDRPVPLLMVGIVMPISRDGRLCVPVWLDPTERVQPWLSLTAGDPPAERFGEAAAFRFGGFSRPYYLTGYVRGQGWIFPMIIEERGPDEWTIRRFETPQWRFPPFGPP